MASIYKSLQVLLTLLYGNITGIVFYDNFIHGIYDLWLEPSSSYNICRVTLGVYLIICVVVGLIGTWRKSYFIQLINGFLLLTALLGYAFVTTIQLARGFDQMVPFEKYKGVTEICLKSIVLCIATFLSFSMSSNNSYSMLPISQVQRNKI